MSQIIYLHAGQPVNADCAACGVAPELDELLDGEDASQVFNAAAILGMATLELVVSAGIPGDPSDMGNADYVAVQVSFKNTGATSWAALFVFKSTLDIIDKTSISSGLDLSGLLQVLRVSVHLSQNSTNPVVLDAEFLDPLLIVGACLVRHWHVLKLGFLGEVDVVHWTISAGWPCAYCP